MAHPTLMSALKRQVHRNPQQVIATWGKEAPTYLEAYSLAGVLMRYFAGIAKLGASDAVLVSSPNSMGMFCAVAAIQASGARTVLVPMGTPREVLVPLLEGEMPRIALVADPLTCACVREVVPDAAVFSMGAPDVDAPSMGYMADQAIGLVDEVWLKVEDPDFDEGRDAKMVFACPGRRGTVLTGGAATTSVVPAPASTDCAVSKIGSETWCIEILASQLDAEARCIVGEAGITSDDKLFTPLEFSSIEGFLALQAAISVGATLALAGRLAPCDIPRWRQEAGVTVMAADAAVLEGELQEMCDGGICGSGSLPPLKAAIVIGQCPEGLSDTYALACGCPVILGR